MINNIFTNFKTDSSDFLQNLSRKIILALCVFLFLSIKVHAQTNAPANAPAATAALLKDLRIRRVLKKRSIQVL